MFSSYTLFSNRELPEYLHMYVVRWLVVQGLTSATTQNMLYGRRSTVFYRSDDPTNSVKALKDGG